MSDLWERWIRLSTDRSLNERATDLNLRIFTTGQSRIVSRNARESIVQALSGRDCNNRGGYDNDITENRRYRPPKTFLADKASLPSEFDAKISHYIHANTRESL